MKIISVVGARPNFMKIAPFIRAVDEYNRESETRNAEPVNHILVHTGQHYDIRMSKTFFEALGIPEADINLEVGSGSHAGQVGQTMMAFEKVLEREKPDWVVVVGDVNATLACSVTAKKMHVKVCHIEAGLRSGDMTMPEEINRLVTDRLSDLLLTPDRMSGENLRREGVPEEKIKFVGNIMIDTLEANREKAGKMEISEIVRSNLIEGQVIDSKFHPEAAGPTSKSQIPNSKEEKGNKQSDIRKKGSLPEKIESRIANPEAQGFALMTMHRPSNVDDADILKGIMQFLTDDVAAELPLLWPVHPRSQKRLQENGLWQKALETPNLVLLHPLGYHEMIRLNTDARMMLTDSGGLQEECCVLGTPCLTLRWNTERPVTLREHGGAGVLVGNNVERMREEYKATLKLERKPQRPELWDGNTARRCVDAILEHSCGDPKKVE